MTIRIGVVGDFNPELLAHTATNESLAHSAARLGARIDVAWLPTPSLAGSGSIEALERLDGIWISAGSPYRDRNGAFAAIRFARERDRPLVAT